MSLKVNFLITDNNITVNYNGETHTVSRLEVVGEKVLEAIKAKDWEAIPVLVDALKKVKSYGDGQTFKVEGGDVLVNGWKVPEVLAKKILAFADQELPYEPLVKFAENLQKNPSYRAVQELFLFLEAGNFPLTDDGCFIAYKKVRADFKDIHSGTMDNSVGNIVEMPRNEVEDDKNVLCGRGLHFCNYQYLPHFGASDNSTVVVEVKINPADVISIPADYSNTKGRASKYEVLAVAKYVDEFKEEYRAPSFYENDDCFEDDYQEEVVYCEECSDELPQWDVDDGLEICEDCWASKRQ